MSESALDYNYPSADEMWAEWVRTHRKHNVKVAGVEWLQCHTCCQPYWLPGRHAVDVLRDEFGR